MLGRSALFVGWGCVGLVGSYAALYILTPYGLTIAAGAGLVAVALHAAGDPPRSEVTGLVAGIGALFLMAARHAQSQGVALPIGVTLVVAAVIAFAVVTRRSAQRL